MSYYNTTNIRGIQLDIEVLNAKNQEDRILNIFKSVNEELTPFDVLYIYNQYFAPVPITSIRRALSDLTKYKHLTKTNNTSKGAFGKVNYKWKLL